MIIYFLELLFIFIMTEYWLLALNSNSHHASYLGLIAPHTCTAFTHTHKRHLHTPHQCEVLICPGDRFWAFISWFWFSGFGLLNCWTTSRLISAWPELGLFLITIIAACLDLCLFLHCSVCPVSTLPVRLWLIKAANGFLCSLWIITITLFS